MQDIGQQFINQFEPEYSEWKERKMKKIRQKVVALFCFLFLYSKIINEKFMEKFIVPLNNKMK